MTATNKLFTTRYANTNHVSTKKAAAPCDIQSSAGIHCIAAYITDDHESPVKTWNMVSEAINNELKLDRVSSFMRSPIKYRPVTQKQSPIRIVKTQTFTIARMLARADVSRDSRVLKYFTRRYPRRAQITFTVVISVAIPATLMIAMVNSVLCLRKKRLAELRAM